jgi:hypothetical protein
LRVSTPLGRGVDESALAANVDRRCYNARKSTSSGVTEIAEHASPDRSFTLCCGLPPVNIASAVEFYLETSVGFTTHSAAAS